MARYTHSEEKSEPMGENRTDKTEEEDEGEGEVDASNGMDPAIQQFSTGGPTLRTQTNQLGTMGKKFQLEPRLKAISSTFSYSTDLLHAKLPVENFWVYDGAYPGLTDRGSIATSRDQILPNFRINEQSAIEWNRVGSKKGWMFEGSPQEKYGHSGENVPSFTSDGWTSRIAETKWNPTPRSEEKQGEAVHDLPAVDIVNNARGIGLTGKGTGNGGMAGGRQEVNPSRLKPLPVPMAKYNWTGNRLHGTGREDQSSGGAGAGGFRAGYRSQYGVAPYIQRRPNVGMAGSPMPGR